MSNQVSSSHESLPVAGEYDVAVIGAGPAGIAAAVSAARLGAQTVLVEGYGYPGGTAVHANVPHIMGFARNERQIVAGLAEEFVRTLAADRRAAVRRDGRSDAPIPPTEDEPLLQSIWTTCHGIRVAANRIITESQVDPLYYTKVTGGVTAGNRITAAVVDMLEGPGLIRADTFVDATGDAMLVHRCGGKTREAPPDEAMTKTMIITLGGVDDFDRNRIAERFNEYVVAGEVPFSEQTYFMGGRQLNPGEVDLNFTLAAGNALSSREMTRMDIELREQIDVTVDWFRRSFSEFADAYLVHSAVQVGVRSGRMIVGRETITVEDIDHDTPVSEKIGMGVRYYGDHGINSFRSPWAKKHNAARPIPRRALLSESFDNVAAAGRCISVEPRVVTCVRLIAQCMATGQAAGINAALAAQGRTSLEAVGYDTVRDFLLEAGAILSVGDTAMGDTAVGENR